MAANPLGEGLDHDGRAILGRTIEVRGRKGVIDKDGHRGRQGVGSPDQRRDVRDVHKRVADGLHVPELSLGRGGSDKGVDVVVLDEGGLHAQVTKGVQEDVPGAAVERVRGDYLVARAHQVGKGENLGRVARGNGNGTGTTLDRGHTSCNGVGGGVGQAAVDVTGAGEGELGSAVLGVLELEGSGGVDGKCRRTGGGIGGPAGVDLQGVEVLLGVLGEVGVEFESHDVCSLFLVMR